MKGYYLFKIFEHCIAESKNPTRPNVLTMTLDVVNINNVNFVIYGHDIITLQSILNWIDKAITDKIVRSVGVTQYISGIICDFVFSSYEVVNNKLNIYCNFTLGKECTTLTDLEKISILADSEILHYDMVFINTSANLLIEMDKEIFINGKYKLPISQFVDITMIQVIDRNGSGVFTKPQVHLNLLDVINDPRSNVGWQ